MVARGNPVNTSAVQRKLSLDMGSRLVPEHGTERNLRKLLLLARSRPHTQGHPGAKKESGPTTEEGHKLPKGLRERSQSSHPARSCPPPRELAPSYEVTPPRDTTATLLKCSRSGCREEGQVLGAIPLLPHSRHGGNGSKSSFHGAASLYRARTDLQVSLPQAPGCFRTRMPMERPEGSGTWMHRAAYTHLSEHRSQGTVITGFRLPFLPWSCSNTACPHIGSLITIALCPLTQPHRHRRGTSLAV